LKAERQHLQNSWRCSFRLLQIVSVGSVRFRLRELRRTSAP